MNPLARAVMLSTASKLDRKRAMIGAGGVVPAPHHGVALYRAADGAVACSWHPADAPILADVQALLAPGCQRVTARLVAAAHTAADAITAGDAATGTGMTDVAAVAAVATSDDVGVAALDPRAPPAAIPLGCMLVVVGAASRLRVTSRSSDESVSAVVDHGDVFGFASREAEAAHAAELAAAFAAATAAAAGKPVLNLAPSSLTWLAWYSDVPVEVACVPTLPPAEALRSGAALPPVVLLYQLEAVPPPIVSLPLFGSRLDMETSAITAVLRDAIDSACASFRASAGAAADAPVVASGLLGFYTANAYAHTERPTVARMSRSLRGIDAAVALAAQSLGCTVSFVPIWHRWKTTARISAVLGTSFITVPERLISTLNELTPGGLRGHNVIWLNKARNMTVNAVFNAEEVDADDDDEPKPGRINLHSAPALIIAFKRTVAPAAGAETAAAPAAAVVDSEVGVGVEAALPAPLTDWAAIDRTAATLLRHYCQDRADRGETLWTNHAERGGRWGAGPAVVVPSFQDELDDEFVVPAGDGGGDDAAGGEGEDGEGGAAETKSEWDDDRDAFVHEDEGDDGEGGDGEPARAAIKRPTRAWKPTVAAFARLRKLLASSTTPVDWLCHGTIPLPGAADAVALTFPRHPPPKTLKGTATVLPTVGELAAAAAAAATAADGYETLRFPLAGGGGGDAAAIEAALAPLLAACHHATFGLGTTEVVDPDTRRAFALDAETAHVAVSWTPHDAGVLHQVQTLLGAHMPRLQAVLGKVNVYGPGGHFKAHVDTPRSTAMVGSLVVCLPTPHTGGELSLRHGGRAATVSWSAASSGTLGWAAFFSDVEHEIAPVTSGYRVTLAYDLIAATDDFDEAGVPRGIYLSGSKPSYQNHGPVVTDEAGLAADTAPAVTFAPSGQREIVPRALPATSAPGLGVRGTISTLMLHPSVLPSGGRLGIFASHAYPISNAAPVTDKLLKGGDAALWRALRSDGLQVRLHAMLRFDPEVGVPDEAVFPEEEAPPANPANGDEWEVRQDRYLLVRGRFPCFFESADEYGGDGDEPPWSYDQDAIFGGTLRSKTGIRWINKPNHVTAAGAWSHIMGNWPETSEVYYATLTFVVTLPSAADRAWQKRKPALFALLVARAR